MRLVKYLIAPESWFIIIIQRLPEGVGFEQDLQVWGQSKGEAPSLDGLEKPRLCLSPHFSFVKRARVGKNDPRLWLSTALASSQPPYSP